MKPPGVSDGGHPIANGLPLTKYEHAGSCASDVQSFANIEIREQVKASAYQTPMQPIQSIAQQHHLLDNPRNQHFDPAFGGVGYDKFKGGQLQVHATLRLADTYNISQQQQRYGSDQYLQERNQAGHHFARSSTFSGFASGDSIANAQHPPARFVPYSAAPVTQHHASNRGLTYEHHTQTQSFNVPSSMNHHQLAPVHPPPYNQYASMPATEYTQRPANTIDPLGEMVPFRDDRPFRPSRKLLNTEPVRSPEMEEALMHVGFNPNYKGDVKWEVLEIPDEENCCLYLKGIPEYATRQQIFDQLCMGGIYTFKLDPPIPERYTTCAAKVAYTTRAAAERLVDHALTFGLFILGNRVKVSWNRNKTRELEGLEARQSRVIQICGPNKMGASKLIEFFHSNIDFTLVECHEWLTANGSRKVVEIHFESILGQSRAAMKCFAQTANSMEDGNDYSVSYAADPCNKSFQYRPSLIGWHHP
jgi:hypothetical protein